MELWGGIECTVNRVGDRFIDQLELSGHASRPEDIDRIAALGIRTVRYPLLWERIAPVAPDELLWGWADERMNRLAANGIEPIVGLVHHGSGPHYTTLLDPRFPRLLADFARAVAMRYPSIRYMTPVNEPMTTARFSGLYGHWYPHRRSAADFARMLLHQCAAVRDSLNAVREVIPEIQLIQTEDFGRTFSTRQLEYQADFENERRWLTNDLLCGMVDDSHPMRKHLAVDDAASRILESLCRDPAPPDVIGVNYYVTSDRFLDDRGAFHNPAIAGGNGRHRYADIEAARVVSEGIQGHNAVLQEVWKRYHIPLALTEAHLGCTREHQMRWLVEAWNGAHAARNAGCDVRALTAWALFGSFGWDNLVTRPPFEYECGAFDVRSRKPRETGVAHVIRELLEAGECVIPPSIEPGWWRGDSRLTVAPYTTRRPDKIGARAGSTHGRARPVLITGARGTLGAAFARVCRSRGIEAVALARDELDIARSDVVRAVFQKLRPWAVVNAAGYVRVDDAEQESESCYRENTFGVSVLAAECARANARFVTFSTDLVFDGSKDSPYVESDGVAPLSTYGASKAAAERSALDLHEGALIIRTSAFFGPWDDYNFIAAALRTLAIGLPFEAASDAIVSPTYVPDLVHSSIDLLLDGEHGIWHLANRGEVSWSDLAKEAASRAGLSAAMLRPVTSDSISGGARHPRYSALGSERCVLLPTLDNALDRLFTESPFPEQRPITA